MLIKNSIIIKNFKLILYSIIISAFLLRVILAIYYYFEGPLKFASEDAIKFHEIAIIFHDYGFTWDYFKTPMLPSIGWIYSYLLSLVYGSCPSIRSSAFLSFEIMEDSDWNSVVELCKNTHVRLNYTIKDKQEEEF